MGLGRDVALIESADAPGPLTLGTLRPAVLLPARLHATLGRAELEAVAVHEFAHVKRCDALTLWAASLVRALLFFHPLVWIAARRVAHLAEDAADDAVLESGAEPVSYAKLLTRMASALPRRAAATEMAVGLALTRSAFYRRVEGILSNRRARFRCLTRRVLAATVAGALLSLGIALAVPLAENQAAPEAGGAAGGAVGAATRPPASPESLLVEALRTAYGDGRPQVAQKLAESCEEGRINAAEARQIVAILQPAPPGCCR